MPSQEEYLDNLLKDLRDSYIDYELKLSKETFNKDGYLRILDLMSRLLQHTIKSLEKGEAHLTQGCQTINSVNGDMEEGHIRHICSHFKEGYMLSALYHNLKRFAELKKNVRCDDSLLESIRAKCKIDQTMKQGWEIKQLGEVCTFQRCLANSIDVRLNTQIIYTFNKQIVFYELKYGRNYYQISNV